MGERHEVLNRPKACRCKMLCNISYFIFCFIPDIDECLSETDCSPLADCINLPGTYRCQCQIGYVGSGIMCNGK